MPPEPGDANDPREWLRRSRSNLARAQFHPSPEILLEDLCFDAQQAAEKAVKAVLVSRQVEFPRTHSIAELLTLLQEQGTIIPANVREAVRLTRYAVEGRYPGVAEEVTAAEHARAVKMAKDVVAFAENMIAESN